MGRLELIGGWHEETFWGSLEWGGGYMKCNIKTLQILHLRPGYFTLCNVYLNINVSTIKDPFTSAS